MRCRSLSLLCSLFLVASPTIASAQTSRFDRILRGLVTDLGDPQRSYDAVDRLRAIGKPAIPALLAVIDPARGADRRRQTLALATLARMGRHAVSALPSLRQFLPKLHVYAARECVLAIGEIGPFAAMGADELSSRRAWSYGPGYTVARMRLMMGPRPSPKVVGGVLRTCPIAAFQVLRQGLCPEFDDEAALIDVFRASAKGFVPRGSKMPWDVLHQHRTRVAWQLEEAAATVVHYTDQRQVLIEAYAVLLYHRDWQMRSRAARRLFDLVEFADKQLLALHLTYALADRSPSVQRCLLRLVPKLATEALAALPAVQAHASSPDPGVAAAARSALDALRPALERVLKVLPAAVRPLERFAACWPSVPGGVAGAARRTMRTEGAGAAAVGAWIRRELVGVRVSKPAPGQVAIGMWRLRATLALLELHGAAGVEFAAPVLDLLGKLKDSAARTAACRAIGAMGPGVAKVVPGYAKLLAAVVQTDQECAILAATLARIEVPDTATKAELIANLEHPNGLVRARSLQLLAGHLDEARDAPVFAKIVRAMRGQHWIRIPGVDRNGGKVTRDVRTAAAQLLWTRSKSPGLRLQAARTLYEWGSVAQRRAVTPFFLAGKPADLTRLLRWCLAKEEDPVLVADALALAAQARPPLRGIAMRLRQLRRSDDPKIAAMASRLLEQLAR